MYTKLCEDKTVERRYREGVISVIIKDSRTSKVHTFDHVKGIKKKNCHTWIGPA